MRDTYPELSASASTALKPNNEDVPRVQSSKLSTTTLFQISRQSGEAGPSCELRAHGVDVRVVILHGVSVAVWLIRKISAPKDVVDMALHDMLHKL